MTEWPKNKGDRTPQSCHLLRPRGVRARPSRPPATLHCAHPVPSLPSGSTCPAVPPARRLHAPSPGLAWFLSASLPLPAAPPRARGGSRAGRHQSPGNQEPLHLGRGRKTPAFPTPVSRMEQDETTLQALRARLAWTPSPRWGWGQKGSREQRQLAGGSARPPPASRGCSGTSPSRTHPRPHHPSWEVQSPALEGQPGAAGRHPAPPWSTRRSPGEPATPGSTRHSHHRAGTSTASAPALCAPSPGRTGGRLGVAVLECSGTHDGLHLCPPPGSLATAGPRGQSAELGSSCHSVPEERAGLSSARLLCFRTGSPERSPRPQFPWPRRRPTPEQPAQSLPRRGQCRVSGGQRGPTFAGTGVSLSSSSPALPRVPAQDLGPWARPTCLPPAKVLQLQCQ